jgi:predicted GIY-YIG superfamily endonuclease
MHRPVRLVYFEHLPNRSEAMRREAQIKRMKRSDKLAQISNLKFQISNALSF